MDVHEPNATINQMHFASRLSETIIDNSCINSVSCSNSSPDHCFENAWNIQKWSEYLIRTKSFTLQITKELANENMKKKRTRTNFV